MTTPRKADGSSKSEYDSWHRGMAAGEAGSEHAPLHPWHETALRILPSLDGCDVLEIGCGRGDFSLELARRFPKARITGIDFSEAAVEIAKSRTATTASPVRFCAADAQSLPFPPSSFDWIVSCECLEHVPDPRKMAAEMARTLRPSGHFIVTTENYLNGMLLAWADSMLRGKPFNSGSGVQPLEHFFLYWQVRRMFVEAKLSVTHMESNHFQWLLLPRVDPAKLCTDDFRRPWLKRLFRPFGRHFTYVGRAAPVADR